jgi:hypothetical protein
MRFAPWSRVEIYVEISRKRAAGLTSQRRARGNLPLLVPLITAPQSRINDVMPSPARSWPARQEQRRNERARDWRRLAAASGPFHLLCE